LIDAIQAPDPLDVVRVLIEKGADPNQLDGNGTAALHQLGWLYRPDMAPVVDYLIAHGADVNRHAGGGSRFRTSSKPEGDTPLHCAANNGQRDYVEVLLAHGAHIEAPGELDKTPLAEAIERGHTDVAALLLQHGADINAKGHESFSPLFLAVQTGQGRLVSFVLQHGADVNYRGFEGDSPKQSLPLTEAAMNGRLGIAKLLLAHGADPGLGTAGQMDTPLHNAIANDRLDFVKAFFEKKAGLARKFDLAQLADQARDGELRAYLLAKAGKSGRIAKEAATCRRVAAMEDAGRFGQVTPPATVSDDDAREEPMAGLDGARGGEPKRVVFDKTAYWLLHKDGRLAALVVATQDGPGRTACTFRLKGAHTVVADMLDSLVEAPLPGEADLSSLVIKAPGLTVLKQFIGAAWHDESLAKWNSADGLDYLLFVAAHAGRSDMVNYLLDRGASVNRTFDQVAPKGLKVDEASEYHIMMQVYGANATPMLVAVQTGNEDSVQALLDHGADPNRSYTNGLNTSALASTAFPGNVSMMEILLRRGALPATVGNFQFDQMIDRRNQEGIRLLLDYGLDRIDVGHQDGYAMQLSEQNKKNPDAVDMIVRMHPVEWKAACQAMPAATLSEQCLPSELRDADTALGKVRARVPEVADDKRRRGLALEAKAWNDKLQNECHARPEFEPRNGWYAAILGNRTAAACIVNLMRRQLQVLDK
jgi:ankyrin repeat protein